MNFDDDRLFRALMLNSKIGGIGRRAWFRSMWEKSRGGSSPLLGTNYWLVGPRRWPARIQRPESALRPRPLMRTP
jgi:hypothetical protein